MPRKPIHKPGSRIRPNHWVDRELYLFVRSNIEATGYKNMTDIFNRALELQRDKIMAIKGVKYGGNKT